MDGWEEGPKAQVVTMNHAKKIRNVMLGTLVVGVLLSVSIPPANAGSKCVIINFQYTDGHSDEGLFCEGNDITTGIHVNELHVSCSDQFEGGVGQKSDLDGHMISSWIIYKLDDDGNIKKVCPEPPEECPPLNAEAMGDGSVKLTFDPLPKDMKLYRGEPGDDKLEKLVKLEEGDTMYHDTDTVVGTTYIYAFDKYGECPVEVTSIPVFPSAVAGALAVVGSAVAYLGIRRRK